MSIIPVLVALSKFEGNRGSGKMKQSCFLASSYPVELNLYFVTHADVIMNILRERMRLHSPNLFVPNKSMIR